MHQLALRPIPQVPGSSPGRGANSFNYLPASDASLGVPIGPCSRSNHQGPTRLQLRRWRGSRFRRPNRSTLFLLAQLRTCVVIETLQCLKKYGQRLDLEIAKEMGVPLATVRQQLASLSATGAVITCNLTRFEGGKRIDAWQCRVSGYVPPPAPGRKAKASA